MANSIESQITISELISGLLSSEEQSQINRQLDRECRRDSQVFWSGVPRESVQKWADHRNLQTLTTAMGPLMNSKNASCLRRTKSSHQWSVYMKGASALFAYRTTRSAQVVVHSRPPPESLHPSGLANYQLIEEPILKGVIGGQSVKCIEMVHITVQGAEDFRYQSWPVNRVDEWLGRFSEFKPAQVAWRAVKMVPEMKPFLALVELAKTSRVTSYSVDDLVPRTVDSEASLLQNRSRVMSETNAKKAETSTPQSDLVKKALKQEEKARKRIAEEEKQKRAREEKARKRIAEEEKQKRTREEKSLKREAHMQKDIQARQEKLRRKMAKEQEELRKLQEKLQRKAAKEAEKKAREDQESIAREEKIRRKKAHKEMEQKAKHEKMKRKKAHEEKQKKEQEAKAKRKSEK